MQTTLACLVKTHTYPWMGTSTWLIRLLNRLTRGRFGHFQDYRLTCRLIPGHLPGLWEHLPGWHVHLVSTGLFHGSHAVKPAISESKIQKHSWETSRYMSIPSFTSHVLKIFSWENGSEFELKKSYERILHENLKWRYLSCYMALDVITWSPGHY